MNEIAAVLYMGLIWVLYYFFKAKLFVESGKRISSFTDNFVFIMLALQTWSLGLIILLGVYDVVLVIPFVLLSTFTWFLFIWEWLRDIIERMKGIL